MKSTYTVTYSKPARKALKEMPHNLALLIVKKIDALAVDPMAPNNNVRKLSNHPGFRLRVGDWRVVYLIEEEVLVISVLRIASRGEIYQ